ncbi:MAG: 4-hydroxy-tetrahydrodipicolinate reductase [Paludibacteraceae bacterium]|nr:4-hydroxy-tetrahydrodipicolinate reductase [Paludibacteraceae bacterium]
MKIAIIGYGKMGHMIEDVARSRGHEIVARIDVGDAFDLKDADVAIEFTTPATAKDNILRAWAQGVPVVCGTTGWQPLPPPSPQGREPRKGEWKIEESSNKVIVKDETGKVMLVWSSNYSVGVNIFFELNKFLAEQMKNLTPTLSSREGEKSEGYTPSIKEIHHIHKLDKPSGTAKTLAEQITNLTSRPLLKRGSQEREMREGIKVPIESVREGEVPGTHEVTWDSEEDTIVITHIAKGRRGFALGAVLAAEKIVG